MTFPLHPGNPTWKPRKTPLPCGKQCTSEETGKPHRIDLKIQQIPSRIFVIFPTLLKRIRQHFAMFVPICAVQILSEFQDTPANAAKCRKSEEYREKS